MYTIWILLALNLASSNTRAANVLFLLQRCHEHMKVITKAYIDFEVDEHGDQEKTRTLYERLLVLSGNHKVWISYAEFKRSSIPLPRTLREEEEDEDAEPRVVAGDPEIARQVFECGYKDLKVKGLKAEVRAAAL